MRSKMYVIGLAAVVILLALGFRILPAPWSGGVAGWFSALWYLSTLAAGLGYWYKLDRAQASEERQKFLAKARQSRIQKQKQTQGRRQRAY
jgi:hypothetical protein